LCGNQPVSTRGLPVLRLPFPCVHGPTFLCCQPAAHAACMCTCTADVPLRVLPRVLPQDDEEELKDAVMEDMADIFSKIDKGGEGVCVQVGRRGAGAGEAS
jgi:hypothetical protein